MQGVGENGVTTTNWNEKKETGGPSNSITHLKPPSVAV